MSSEARALLLGVLILGAACAGQDETERAENTVPSDSVTSELEGPAAAIEQGIEIYRRGEYDSAAAIAGTILTQATSTSDSSTEASALTLLGLIAYRRGDLKEARDLGERALNIKLSIGMQGELSRSYNALGLIAWNQSRLRDAIDLFDETMEHAPADAALRTRAVVSINKGLVQSDLGEFQEARASFETARDVSVDLDNQRLEAIALNNLGMLEEWTGNPHNAIAHLDRAVSLYREIDYRVGEVNALGQIGTARMAMGDLGQAIATLDSSIALARETGMRAEEASSLEMLAQAVLLAGDTRRALDLYEQAEAINDTLGLHMEKASDLRSRAEIYAHLGEYAVARQLADEALETHRSGENRWEQLSDLLFLADLAHEMEDEGPAQAHLEEARELAQTFDARTARVYSTLARARIADRDGNARGVLEALEEIREDLEFAGYDTKWESRMLSARALQGTNQLDSAMAAGREAVAAVERNRVSLRSGSLRLSYAARRLEAYATLVDILLDADDPTAAFEVAASERGTVPIGSMAPSKAGSSSDDFSEAEVALARIRELEARTLEFDQTSPVERDSSVLRELVDLLSSERDRFELLRLRAVESDPFASTMLGIRPVDASEVQGSLRADEALLQYLITEESASGFVVTRDNVRAFKIDENAPQLLRRVRLARELAGRPDAGPEEGQAVLSRLYDLLIAPALGLASTAPVSRLIIVPHGVLTYLPFAALWNEADRRYLVEDFHLLVVPSAAALTAVRASPQGTRAGRVSAFAPFSDRLPATREEVRAVREAVSGTTIHEGRRSTERRFRKALDGNDIVHVATHASLNPWNPLFSELQLARGSGDPKDDGRVSVREVLQMHVGSPLVFLAGCETGLGSAWQTSYDHGQDYRTLALSFMYAGATNVVATLWRVEDEGSAAFAARFYSSLEEQDPVLALSSAQRSLLSDPAYRAPYYWAAYQLAGSGHW